MGWAYGTYGWGEGVYRVLVGKPEGKRPLGKPRRRWVDNIRMDLQEEGCGYMDWIGRAQDRDRWRRLVSAVMNLRVPWNEGNFCKPVSLSRRTPHHGVSKYCCLDEATLASSSKVAVLQNYLQRLINHSQLLRQVLFCLWLSINMLCTAADWQTAASDRWQHLSSRYCRRLYHTNGRQAIHFVLQFRFLSVYCGTSQGCGRPDMALG